ncbi:MAG: H/ACA ribonucleoprotein complex subunit GAR1 [Candidatus Methanospirareceae archaeon]
MRVKERGFLGRVLHIVDKKLIVKGGKVRVKKVINAVAVTEDKKKIGKVYDVFGPVNRPYVGIKIFGGIKEEELKELLHKKLFVVD